MIYIITSLYHQLDDKTEEFSRCRLQLEESRSECLKYQTQLREMEERFFHSDVKTKEEVGRELRVWRIFFKCLNQCESGIH